MTRLHRTRALPFRAYSIAAAGFACAMSAQGARAQVLDSFFVQNGTAAGGIPADDTQARTTSEYTPLGVRLGSFTILPLVTESLGYDSNINGLGIGASPVIDSTGNLVARSGWARNSVSAQFSVDDRRYPSQPSQSSTSWSADLGATLDLGHDQLGANYDHLSQVETPDAIGSVAARPVPYQVNIASLSYTFAAEKRLSFVPSLRVDRYDFASLAIGGTNTTEAWRNRTVLQQELVTRYEVAPKMDTLLVFRGTEVSYDNALPGLPKQSSTGGSVLVGIDYTADDIFRYRALVGYQTRHYNNSLYGSLNAPIAEVSVTWSPTRLNTVTLTLRRDIEDSASEGVSAFTYTAAEIAVAHELRRNVMIGADAEVQIADGKSTASGSAALAAATSSSNQTIYSVGAKAQWMLNRSLSLNASARFASSSGEGTRSYHEAVGLLAVSLGI